MTPLTNDQVCDQLHPAVAQARHDDAELATLRSALGSYRAQTLQWAERRSATQPSLVAQARRSERWAALPRWSLATIAIVTIAAGVAHVSEGRGNMAEDASLPPVAAVQETRSSAAEIAADNKLLNSIDAELSYHSRSPVDGLDLKGPATSGQRQAQIPDGSED